MRHRAISKTSNEGALSCYRVKVGGGRLEDGVMNMAMQPLLWAGAAALWLSYSGSPLPAMVCPSKSSTFFSILTSQG